MHEEVLLGHRVQWTRRGRAWTIEERRELVTEIENAWLAMFPNGHGTRIVGEYLNSNGNGKVHLLRYDIVFPGVDNMS